METLLVLFVSYTQFFTFSTHVTLPDGTKKILPLLAECLKMDYTGPSPSSSSPSSSTSPSEGKSKVGEYINDGWLDNAEYYTISRNRFVC